MADLQGLKRKEAKTITFTIKNEAGAVVDCSAATFTFIIKNKIGDAAAVITKADADFGKGQAAVGVVTVNLSATDLDRVGSFKAELKIYFSATNIDKSATMSIVISEAGTS